MRTKKQKQQILLIISDLKKTKVKIIKNSKQYFSTSKDNKIINRYNSYNNIGAKNRFDKYKIKKILKGYNGKEFSRKENFIDNTKCIKRTSGGPKEKRKLYNKLIKRAIIQKKLNLIEKNLM